MSGLKKTQHGYNYQLELILLAAISAVNDKKTFTIMSEAKEQLSFNDLVIDTGESIILLQAKHSSKTNDSYSKKDFCDTHNNDCSLAKYFSSWTEIKKLPTSLSKKCWFILFVNKFISDQDTFLQTTDNNFLPEATISTFKFKSSNRDDLMNAIKFYSSFDFQNELNQEDIKKIIGEDYNTAKSYLKTQFAKNKKKIYIDKRCKLPYFIRALIKICCLDPLFEKKLVGNDGQFLKDFNKYKHLITVDNKYPTNYLSSNQLMDEKINQFLDEMFIQIGCSTNEHIIKEKLKFECSIAHKELYHAWLYYINKWLSDTTTCSINSEEIKKFIYNTKGDLHRYYRLGQTQYFQEQCKTNQSLLNEADITKNLDSFLNNKNEPFIALIINEGGGIKQHVYNSVIRQKGLLDAEWFYFKYNLGALSIDLPQVLSGESTKIGIVNFCKEGNNINQIYLSNMIYTANNYRKKLLLLIETNQKEVFKNLLNDIHFEEISFRCLTNKEITEIINGSYKEHCLSIAGKNFKLTDLVNSSNSGLYNLMNNYTKFHELLSNAKLPCSDVKNEDIYISNDLIKATLQYSLRSLLTYVNAKQFYIQIESKTSDILNVRIQNMFVSNLEENSYLIESLKYNSKYKLSKFENKVLVKEKIIFIVNNHDIAQHTNDSISINVVKINEDNVFATVHKNECKFYLPVHDSYTFKTENQMNRNDLKSSNNFSILSAYAGLGKTSYSQNDVNSWIKDKNSEQLWVVCIRLPDLQFSSDNPDLSDAFQLKSTGFEWEKWHLEALFFDMQIENKVRLLMDGLDEIKELKKLERFNKWLSKVPTNTSITITTRPYAANKILKPSKRNLDFFIRLKDFDEIQQKEYIIAFISAIYREKKIAIDTAKIEEISENVFKLLKGASFQKLLGIPLECYLFCEHLKPKIIKCIETEGSEIELKSQEELKDLSAVCLVQNFISVKLYFFLQKHMKMSEKDTLNKPHRIYCFSSSYIELLITFAFRQAFSLEYSFIEEQLIDKYFKKEMFEESNDFGILNVETIGNETYLKFRHETYQEYFSALFIFKELLSIKANKAEEMLIKHRFDPQFHLIITLAAQLFIEGDPLFPVYNAQQILNKGMSHFISIICNDDDILGSANSDLLNKCFKSISPNKLDILYNSIENFKELFELSKGQISRKDVEQIPIINEDNTLNDEKEITDLKLLKNNLFNKFRVLKTIKNLSSNSYSQAAEIFLEIIENKDLNSYWDIDGGFEAIALLKNAFNEKLASYFIKRLDSDAEWRAEPILNAIKKIQIKDLESNASKAFMRVFFSLRNHINKSSLKELRSSLVDMLLIYEELAIYELKDQLIESMQTNSSPSLESITNETNFMSVLINLFWCAHLLKYAVIFKNCQIQLVKQKVIVIDLKEFIDKGEFFNEYLTKVILIMKEKRKTFFDIIIGHSLIDLENLFAINEWDSYRKFKNLKDKNALSALTDDEENFSNQFKNLNDQSKKSIFGQLFEYKLVKEYIVVLFGSLLAGKKYDEIMFDIIQYTGDYFNQKVSDYIMSCGHCNDYLIFGKILKRLDRNIANKSAIDCLYQLIKTYIGEKDYCFEVLIKDLSELQVLDQNLADIFISEFESDKATTKTENWSRSNGINAVKYVGKYFNQKCVDYLKLRASCYADNKEMSINSLKEIKSLLEEHLQDQDYENAISAYNSCCDSFGLAELVYETDCPKIKKQRMNMES